MKKKFIPVATPVVGGSEIKNVLNALLTKEISGYSKQYIPRFEKALANYVGTKHAIVVNSGTSAIHLALVALGIGPGDKVAVASYTNMASFFPVLQLGATPIPVDIESESWNMDPEDLIRVITPELSAIIVVHIFGHPAKMDEIMSLAKLHNIPVIEDCAEALGALNNGQMVGAIGVMGCHSFYANKMITTGEGGAVTTDSDDMAERVRSFASLSFGKVSKFIHEADGYNFRMSNIQAALGMAQLERISKNIDKKRNIATMYHALLSDETRLQLPSERENQFNVYWMYHIRILGVDLNQRDWVISQFTEAGIETRPAFVPYSDQDKVLNLWNQSNVRATPRASSLGRQALYLPTGPNLKNKEIKEIAHHMKRIISQL